MLFRSFLNQSLKKTRPSFAEFSNALKKPYARVLGSFFSLPFFIFLFILVLAAGFVLMRKIIGSLSEPAFFQGPQAFLFLFALPFSLIVLAVAFLYALHSQMLKTGKIHSTAMRHFKLICIFAALVAVIFCIFVNLLITDLFSVYHDESIPKAIESSVEIAEAFIEARLLQAETAANQLLTGFGIWSLTRNPSAWLPSLRNYDPYALAIQVYAASGGGNFSPIKEEGDFSAFIGMEDIARLSDGTAVTEYYEDEETLIRIKKTVRYAGFTYIALYTSLLPKEVYRVTLIAQKAELSFYVLQNSKTLFPFLGFLIYSGFILPPMLILLLCAFYVCVRLSDPIVALEVACQDLSQGKADISLIPQQYAGLDNSFAFVNAKSDTLDYRHSDTKEARLDKLPDGDNAR